MREWRCMKIAYLSVLLNATGVTAGNGGGALAPASEGVTSGPCRCEDSVPC